jgi:hypothetical protein
VRFRGSADGSAPVTLEGASGRLSAVDVRSRTDDKQHWPPTCFEEKQGTSPLLLPLRPRLERPAT